MSDFTERVRRYIEAGIRGGVSQGVEDNAFSVLATQASVGRPGKELSIELATRAKETPLLALPAGLVRESNHADGRYRVGG